METFQLRKNQRSITRRAFVRSGMTLGCALALPAFNPAFAQGKPSGVLNVVPQADLRSLDPVWTTAQITANHGYMIYDTLFAVDGDFKPKPQMIGDHEVSEDGKSYRFTLREGLAWHDGSPVTAKDCIASLKRWAVRSAEGKVMIERGARYEAVDDLTFVLKFDEPFGMVELAFANPVNPCFMMREKEASNDAYTEVKESIGSGPFKFVRAEWAPGNQVVYERNEAYVPRDEPADGLAGGKLANVDRVVWVYIPDSGTAASALMTGEVDMLEFPAHDLLPVISANPDIEVKVIDSIGYQGMLRMNSLVAPFDKAEARQAVFEIVQARQDEYLAAMVGVPDYQKTCLSPFVCGSPSESQVGLDQFTKDGLNDRVKALLKKAGYAGEPIVVMDPTDQHLMHMMVLVFSQHLRDVGINVDLQATDWGTLGSRRPTKAAPKDDPAGWHFFPTWWPGFTMQNPITNIPLAMSDDASNWYGWPNDPELERIRVSYVDAKTDEQRSAVMDLLQRRFFEIVPYIPVGQFLRPVAFRKDRLKGVIGQQSPVFWNIDKSAS